MGLPYAVGDVCQLKHTYGLDAWHDADLASVALLAEHMVGRRTAGENSCPYCVSGLFQTFRSGRFKDYVPDVCLKRFASDVCLTGFAPDVCLKGFASDDCFTGFVPDV